MVSSQVSRKVLQIGPDYKGHRGGIGALLDIYKDHYEVFNFIPSFRNLSNNTQKLFFFLKQLVKVFTFLSKQKEIQVVHIHSAKSGSLYRKLIIAFIAKKFFKKKVVNHIHTGHFKNFYDNSNWISKKSIRYYLQLNDATITVSDFWKGYFIESFNLKNVYKLNNIVPTPGFRNKIEKENTVNFLFLGVITNKKGIFDLVNLIAENKKELEKKIKLIIGGSGDSNLLQQIIKNYQLENCIDFKGWVTGNEKEKLLQDSDVYILPSYFEGVPISILEAMSFGKPIISTNVGGIPEVVENGVNGVLVTPGDKKALLNAMLYYTNDIKKIAIHGNQSLSKVKDYYPDTVTKQLEDIYIRLFA
jgi:glycosyltransferase involved in cell wall biosynthesis